jgi:hypothetical protein
MKPSASGMNVGSGPDTDTISLTNVRDNLSFIHDNGANAEPGRQFDGNWIGPLRE